MSVSRKFAFLSLLLALSFSSISAHALGAGPLFADLSAADRALGVDAAAFHALQDGRVDEATLMLRATLAANPNDALAHQLFCRVYYAQDMADEAIRQCELAVSNANSGELGSDNNLWLGRAYGMKARHAGPLAGFTLARKVEACFSRAVELNPSSVAAINDLGEYYVDAPFIVGGGTDKARSLATRVMPRFPGAAHLLLARINVADNHLAVAESEFKLAINADRSPDAWVDLAAFYQKQARPDDAVVAVKSALAVDHVHGSALVDAAAVLTKANRAPDLSERCLRDYLASRAKSDDAPAFKIHLQLARLLVARKDFPDANREIAAAAALAAAYTRNARSAQGL
jgi:tetratricopeptide (TPR) repeat protein